MTSQYALYETAKLRDRFQLGSGLPKGVKPNHYIKPTMDAPVVISRDGRPQVELMKWGLVAKGAKDANSVFRYKTYNVPSEKMLSKHSWDTAVRHSRCLVPVNGFYEPKTAADKKQTLFVQFKDQSVFALAGIYSVWETPEGVATGTYSVLTIDTPNQTIAPTTGRIPVIIAAKDEARWLDPAITDVNALYDMIRPYPSHLLQVV